MYTRKNGRGRYGGARNRTRRASQKGGARDEDAAPFSLEGLRDAIIGKPEETTKKQEDTVKEVTDDMLSFESTTPDTEIVGEDDMTSEVEDEGDDMTGEVEEKEEEEGEEGEKMEQEEKGEDEDKEEEDENGEDEKEEDEKEEKDEKAEEDENGEDEKEKEEPVSSLDTVSDVATAFSNYYGVDTTDVTKEAPDIEYKTLHEETLMEKNGQLCFKKKLVKDELIAVLFHSSIGFKHGVHEYPAVDVLKKYTRSNTPVNVIVKQEKLPMKAEYRKGVYVATMALTLKTTEDVLPGTSVVCPYVPDMSSSKEQDITEVEKVEEEVLMGSDDDVSDFIE